MKVKIEITSPNNCDHFHVKLIHGVEEKKFVFLKDELIVSEKKSFFDITEEDVKSFLRQMSFKESLLEIQDFKVALENKDIKI